ncbi:methyl-accepting chemotaxis protein [Halobacteriovorax sp. GB3]|uniref:methyl-accepting chemotaxis protein n=1 Tax=Halobacteriovorax sp. GB3 TaxID=2719615 RepID=UPI0023612C85|nr:methyl-accepting chemotaxis protein [Halobacteriovorax sp. GB3]MDD0851481.1 methyl-accepting chemotaxis protein [Halobacteriovorax sp. GB3]
MGFLSSRKISLSAKVYALAAIGVFSILAVGGINTLLGHKTDQVFEIDRKLKSLVTRLDQEKILRIQFLLNHDDSYLTSIAEEQKRADKILNEIVDIKTNEEIDKNLKVLAKHLKTKNEIFSRLSTQSLKIKKNEQAIVKDVYAMSSLIDEMAVELRKDKEKKRLFDGEVDYNKEELNLQLKDKVIKTRDILFKFNGLILGDRVDGFKEGADKLISEIKQLNKDTSLVVNNINEKKYTDFFDKALKVDIELISEFSKTLDLYQDNESYKEEFEDHSYEVDGAIVSTQDSLKAFVQTEAKLYKTMAMAFAAIMIIILAIVSFLIVKPMNLQLNTIVNSLRDFANLVFKSSEEFMDASQTLSESSNRQASSVQETVSSLDEISAMVRSNVDVSDKTKDLTNNLKSTAEDSKRVVEGMINSIQNVSESNDDIMKQMDKTNAEMENISKVIAEIGEKTKIINDIVFQTKLLSFNASVEAARAGEHGKGFAVVAEEVGNLAQVSGDAATEISDMLNESIKNVQTMVEGNKEQIETLIQRGKEKVDHSISSAHQCSKALEEMLEKVLSVNEMTSQVAVASREQSEGITEINKAMGYIDQSTQENTEMANSTSDNASSLNEQAKKLNHTVDNLMGIIHGANAQSIELSKIEAPKKEEKIEQDSSNDFENVVFMDEVESEATEVASNEERFEEVVSKESEPVVEVVQEDKKKIEQDDDINISASSVIPDRDDDRFEDVG